MREKNQDYETLSSIFNAWWNNLQSRDKATGEPIKINGIAKPPNRQALAQLRRVNGIDNGGASAVDVVMALGIDEFRALLKRLNDGKLTNSQVRRWLNPHTLELEPFVIAAASLAHIRDDASRDGDWRGATAKLLGAGFPDEQPFAEARFKRLMRCRNDWPDLMIQARRVSAILERKAPVGDFAASIVLWNAEPRTIRDWAFQYYQKDFEPAGEPPVAAPTAAISA